MKKLFSSAWVYVGVTFVVVLIWAVWEALQILLAIKKDVDAGIAAAESAPATLGRAIAGGFAAVGAKIGGGFKSAFSFITGNSSTASDALSPEQIDSQLDADFNTPDPGQGNGETISPDGVVSQGPGTYSSY